MSVGSWQPDAAGTAIDVDSLRRLAACAVHLDDPSLGLSAREVADYAGLMRRDRDAWQVAESLDDATLIALIRFFTVAEQKLPNWEAGNQSPVIALAGVLRGRKAYPQELTGWIRSHSDNRFLPWGSLLDRL
ncbi:MAG: hypothetical protein HC809_11130 [Gammaproteobacteria bacterium]|nr:hypothetical protein [Gammaproteobacteria bacterium]